MSPKNSTKQISNHMSRRQSSNATSTELQMLVPSQGHSTHGTSNHEGDHTQGTKLYSQDRSGKGKRLPQGWRFGVVCCAISTSTVCLLNFIGTVWGLTRHVSGHGVIFEGDCQKVQRMNTLSHLLINLFGTVLLSSSNYCMQCLSAPTRHEVNKAHTKGVWLDIGIPSFRNLKHIRRMRVVLWTLLALSSLPLHLFYNSAVFSSTSSNSYFTFSVSQSFISNPECLGCDRLDSLEFEAIDFNGTVRGLHQSARNGELDRLENGDCIDQYGKMIQTYRRNVLLVASDDKFPVADKMQFPNGTAIYSRRWFSAADAMAPGELHNIYRWICSGTQPAVKDSPCYKEISHVRNNQHSWVVDGYPVDYCLSERVSPRCKLQFNASIAILVIVLNVFKVSFMFCTVLLVKEDPLMTIGDAVASFMTNNDPTTNNMCLLTQDDAKDMFLLSKNDMDEVSGRFQVGTKKWRRTTYRWKDATSLRRRIIAFTMYMIILIIISYLLWLGIKALPDSKSFSNLVHLGFGTVDPRTTISWGIATTSTISNVLVANSAQVILSAIYFSYNGLFTCMLLGQEWASYAHHRKGLRVSKAPDGAQRSTYFLQLPYRISLPLMALSGSLHYLVSQSIFLVAVDIYEADGSAGSRIMSIEALGGGSGWKTCGYSPIAIISVMILGMFMIIGGIAIGFVPYKVGMNKAGSCSAAISAACHNSKWDGIDGYTASTGRVKWGVIGKGANGIGHCAFSTEEVEFPQKGQLYAGQGKKKLD